MADSSSSSTTAAGSPSVLVAVYWLIVGIPLAWGVYQTVQKSLPLFQVAGSAATSAPAAATPPPLTATPPAAAAADPTVVAPLAPAPDASPFSTPQPSAAVAPINPPASPVH